MLIKLLNDETKKSFSKQSKQIVDEAHSEYHPSSYWDHKLTKFFEVSESQKHAEAIKEWELIGYKFNPDGQNCFFHENKTYHLYILKNKLNGNEIEVGEDCASSHSLPIGQNKYSKQSYEQMHTLCKEQRKTIINAKGRQFLETHGFLIEDALDMLNKYRDLIINNNKDSKFEENIAALAKLYKEYKSSRRAAAGERMYMIYWHDSHMKKITQLLNTLYKNAPLLKEHKGFERKMRALYNFRTLFTETEKNYIEQMHTNWNKNSTKTNAQFPISTTEANQLMSLYEKMLSESNLMEIDLQQDGQFRLTLRLFENYYKNILNKENNDLLNLIKDSLMFLLQKSPAEVEKLQGKIEIIKPRRVDRDPSFTIEMHLKKFIEQVNDVWQGTGVITRESKEKLDETLVKLRDKELRLTQAQINQQDSNFANKIAFLIKYKPLFKREQKTQIDDIYKTWENNRFFKESVTAVNELYHNLNNEKYKYTELIKAGIPGVQELQHLVKLNRIINKLNSDNENHELNAEEQPYYEKYINNKFFKGWIEKIEKSISLTTIEKALELLQTIEFKKDFEILNSYYKSKNELTELELKVIEFVTKRNHMFHEDNLLSNTVKNIHFSWLIHSLIKTSQLTIINNNFYEGCALVNGDISLTKLVAKANELTLTDNISNHIDDFDKTSLMPKYWAEEIHKFLTEVSFQHTQLLEQWLDQVVNLNHDKLNLIYNYLANNNAQREYQNALKAILVTCRKPKNDTRIKILDLIDLVVDDNVHKELSTLLRLK